MRSPAAGLLSAATSVAAVFHASAAVVVAGGFTLLVGPENAVIP